MNFKNLPTVPGVRNRHSWVLPTYMDLPVQVSQGPLVAEYLEIVYGVLMRARAAHPRLFAVRFDLSFPVEGIDPAQLRSNDAIARFWLSLKAQIAHNRDMATQQYQRAHSTELHYAWAREYCPKTGRPHYHCCLFLNAHAFCGVGMYDVTHSNLYSRIVRAWARALRASTFGTTIPVHFCQGGAFKLEPQDGLDGLFSALSYLCKEYSKDLSDGVRSIGTSR